MGSFGLQRRTEKVKLVCNFVHTRQGCVVTAGLPVHGYRTNLLKTPQTLEADCSQRNKRRSDMAFWSQLRQIPLLIKVWGMYSYTQFPREETLKKHWTGVGIRVGGGSHSLSHFSRRSNWPSCSSFSPPSPAFVNASVNFYQRHFIFGSMCDLAKQPKLTRQAFKVQL